MSNDAALPDTMEEKIDIEFVEVPSYSFITKKKRGQMIHSDRKLEVINLYKRIKKAAPEMLKKQIVTLLSEESGVSNNSIKKILLEYKRTGGILIPNRKRCRRFKDKSDDEVNKKAIRRKIHEFYMNNIFPTTVRILQALSDDKKLLNFKRSTFYLLMKELNFTFTFTNQGHILTETQDLVIWRRTYLKTIKRYREEGRQIYYLDETWINVDDTANKDWMETVKFNKDASFHRLTAKPAGPSEEDKLLFLHIGSAAGFVPDGLLCFPSTAENYYSNEITVNLFHKWFKRILPSLDDNAVIVMDNAPHHCAKVEKLPDISWKKGEIIKWLESKGKEVSAETMAKAELLHIVAQQKNKFDKYIIDEMAKQEGKTVLRLPPYHSDLNPIEIIWSMIKKSIKSSNNNGNAEDVKLLVEQGVSQI
ncbi:PREDICTED: uncharacterized protein LOC105452789 isoform X2 [Wasmannia auropunctata]|uniref:uncharacterized protein LOC105452789 isoform X2 n=1 Tax=Wasmannia auropunctata TaxID=64793 RepID=UPI0005EDDC61|nr:PREDICTED: uncharacterized protein LOC105452789 isoform X2 [Wasmannia auropunctata]